MQKDQPRDKFKAIWLSYSSITDFLKCPKAYYLKYVFKNPKTGRKIGLIKPPLLLGSVIHKVIDELSTIKTEHRFDTPLIKMFDAIWTHSTKGALLFASDVQKKEYYSRGKAIVARLEANPGPLAHRALKIKESIPYYWFSEKDNLILCGKIDWLEYIQKNDAVGVVEFKTGKGSEREDSLQLPIYYLIAQNCQNRAVERVSYWYVERDEAPIVMDTPDVARASGRIADVGGRIKLARQLNHFKCPKDDKTGCVYCAPLQAIVEGRGRFAGIGDMNEELYVLDDSAVSL